MEGKPSGKKAGQPMFSAESMANDFTVVKSSILSNSLISYMAKGILITCLSSGRAFSRDWILSHGKGDVEEISSALKELRSLGFLKKVQNGDDCFYVFTDSPEGQASPDLPAIRKPSSRSAKPAEPIALESWLEPHRGPLERWLRQRLKAHPKLAWEITGRSVVALKYAYVRGVLADFCELAAESTWVSLGFAGYKEYIEKLVKEKHPTKQAKPPMAEISYTLK
jgi:hypothetical protein